MGFSLYASAALLSSVSDYYAAKLAEKERGVAELPARPIGIFALRVVVQHQHLDLRGVFAPQCGIR